MLTYQNKYSVFNDQSDYYNKINSYNKLILSAINFIW